MKPPIQDVEIVAPAKEWEKIRVDPRFLELMRLARITNSLSLAYGPILHTLEDQSPKARRDRFAAFFFAAAVLKEGLDTARSLGRWYRKLPQFKEGFGPILNDAASRALHTELLKKVRNELVFHFDREAIAEGLSHFPAGDARIATYPSSGPASGEMYFDVADDAILGYLFGSARTEKEYLERLEDFMSEVSKLFKEFMKGAHRLLAVGFVELGCRKRTMDRPAGLSDEADEHAAGPVTLTTSAFPKW